MKVSFPNLAFIKVFLLRYCNGCAKTEDNSHGVKIQSTLRDVLVLAGLHVAVATGEIKNDQSELESH